ncbi:hypothetical protein SASPL_147389 [Salvia splendens]|uniref:OEC 23 kDa subunit n=1 Tax=Salvia splendens TaxID=180675 RepID=A0A8X8WF30_SALSN|nr:uncharacterized protein LOC121775783 [Salvia splendens]KAG6393154.1 hypothetical protein SASPL_147389 [Salvia splendens]
MTMPKLMLSISPSPSPSPSPSSPPPTTSPHPSFPFLLDAAASLISRRTLILASPVVALSSSSSSSAAAALAQSPSKSFLSGIANTKSWFQFYGDGFSIRVPPNFQDIMEPEDYNAGLSLYGDKAKPKTYAARFATPDGSEVLSVVIRPSNSLKITFLEAQDIADLGSLKDAAKIFVPVGATLYSARTFKIKEEDGYRNYYFYEFGGDEQRVAIVAAVNSGKAIIAGATAPERIWDDDGIRLRSAAVSLTIV